MIFSLGLDGEQFGRAIVVPCKQRAKDIDDLILEAERLWSATGHHGGLGWGMTVLQLRPVPKLSPFEIDHKSAA